MKTKQHENKVEPILYALQWKNENIIDNEFVFHSFDDAKDYLEDRLVAPWDPIDKRTSFRDTFIVPLYKDVKEGSVYKFSCCVIQWSGENKPDNEFVFDSFRDAEEYCEDTTNCYGRPRCTTRVNSTRDIIPLYRSILDTFSL
jgi:hypothetical protein